MTSSSNPYEHYNQPHVEDDDLIDPDDGTSLLLLNFSDTRIYVAASLTNLKPISMISMTLSNLHHHELP
jgi:hypothetical protein